MENNRKSLTTIHYVPTEMDMEWFDILYKDLHHTRFDLSEDLRQVFNNYKVSELHACAWINDIVTMATMSTDPYIIQNEIYSKTSVLLEWFHSRIVQTEAMGYEFRDLVITEKDTIIIIYELTTHNTSETTGHWLTRLRLALSENF